jgi:phage terminase small subunit
LTPKQRAFVLEYIKDFNATQAAIRAGYSPKTARQIGQQNLTKLVISQEIDKEFKARAMSSDEVLVRMADQAKGSAGDFLTIDRHGYASLDLERMKKEGKLHLIKKYKVTKQGTEVELYNAQNALIQLGKHHGLWEDKEKADWRREIIELLKTKTVTPEQVQLELGSELARELFESVGISPNEVRETSEATSNGQNRTLET